MDARVTIVILLAGIGFIFSLISSVIAGASAVSIIVRSLLSGLAMGGIGLAIIIVLKQFAGIDMTDSTATGEKPANAEAPKAPARNSEPPRTTRSVGRNEQPKAREPEEGDESGATGEASIDELDKTLADSGDIVSESRGTEEDEVSYESLFKKFDREPQQEKERGKQEPGATDDTPDPASKRGRRAATEPTNEKKGTLDEMQEEADKESEAIHINTDDVKNSMYTGDSDMGGETLNEDESRQIQVTSSDSFMGSGVRQIDDNYIYIGKNTKIENKPQKMAKIISEMMKE